MSAFKASKLMISMWKTNTPLKNPTLKTKGSRSIPNKSLGGSRYRAPRHLKAIEFKSC